MYYYFSILTIDHVQNTVVVVVVVVVVVAVAAAAAVGVIVTNVGTLLESVVGSK